MFPASGRDVSDGSVGLKCVTWGPKGFRGIFKAFLDV